MPDIPAITNLHDILDLHDFLDSLDMLDIIGILIYLYSYIVEIIDTLDHKGSADPLDDMRPPLFTAY